MSAKAAAFPIEDFVQSLSSQLDRAQDTLALKARTGRPLTFALKDLSIELKVFWEAQADGRLVMRHAQPTESGASTVNFSFTTITRSMLEENSISFAQDEDSRNLSEIGGDDGLEDGDRRRFELAGVRTVGQFRKVLQGSDPQQVEALIGTPVDRLRLALERSAKPVVTGHDVVRRQDGRPLLRIRGANLINGERPKVRIAGEAVEVLEARANEILVKPARHHREGTFEVLVGGLGVEGFFELPAEPEPAREEAT